MTYVPLSPADLADANLNRRIAETFRQAFRSVPQPDATPEADPYAETLAAGRAARLAALQAHRHNPERKARAAAARWPNGPGPITHGTSTTMAARCAGEQPDGRACTVCLAANAARMAAYKRRRRGIT